MGCISTIGFAWSLWQFPENVTEGHFVHAAQGRNVVEGRLAYKGASASDKDSLIKLGLVWPSPDCHPHSSA